MPFEGVPLRGESSPPLPVNVVAEQNLLGAILVNNAAYAASADIVRPEHFGTPVHGRIFESCGKLIERGIPANAVTLKNRFDQDAALEAIGGAHYLARLAIDAVTIINAPHYAVTIRDCWRRRELIGLAQDLVNRAYLADIDDPAEKIAESAGAALDALLAASGEAGRTEAPEGLRPAAEAAKAALGRSEAAYKGEAQSGVMSGIDSLDRITGGFQRGDLIYIGKRPSMGGTAFCVTVALNAARAGKRVAFWSAEMNRTRIGHRMLAWLTGISTRTQRIGALAGDEWSRLIEAQRELDGLPLLIDDSAPIGASTIRRRARQAQQRGGLDLMLVDYLQLVRASDGHEDMPLRDSVPRVSGQLRDLAKELDLPIVCLAQLKPEIDQRENKRPLPSDIRWTGDAEQDAGMIAMLYRDEHYLENGEPRAAPGSDPLKADRLHADWANALADSRGRAEVIICKARDDSRGTAHCAFDAARSLFFDDGRQGRFW